MHLVRLDIDKKNAASQYHVGPLGAGLNAIYSPLVANSTLLTRFTKSLLFRGQTLGEFDDSEFASIDGSLTWVDASGHLRMLDCAGGKPLLAQLASTLQPALSPHNNSGTNSLPANAAQAYTFQNDDERIRGIGNMFWEGQGDDHRWDELRADLLSMIFCSPLGSTSPEKLWWSASKLGVHCTARRELDEGYKQLKEEEAALLVRLRESDPVDHDRTWWLCERDRLRTDLQHILVNNQLLNTPATNQTPASLERETPEPSPQTNARNNPWDYSQLSEQLAHAELMIERWNQRAQAHQRLAQVQSLLQTRSPYRRTSSGSLIPTAERFLSELTSGAVRQLPAWAMEASYLQAESINAGLRFDSIDSQLPPTHTRQRRLVDLAIRLAIAQSARSRVGRIPFMLEHSIDGFRGEPLEQILHVLANFSRDGWQILLITADEHIARRIAGHGGSVARVHENLRYAKPHYVIDSDTDLGLHPVLDQAPMVGNPAGAYNSLGFGAFHDYRDINRHLEGLAVEHESESFNYAGPFDPWQTSTRPIASRNTEPVVVQRNGRTFYLAEESSIDALPGIGTETIQRLRSVGAHRVGDLFAMPLNRIVSVTGLRPKWIQNTLSVAELMCKVPQMRPFDARVLVACGVTSSKELAAQEPLILAKRVHRFLTTEAGRMLRKTASRGELVRLRQWIHTVYQQHGIHSLADGEALDFNWDKLNRKNNRPTVVRMAQTDPESDEDPDVREDAGQSVSEFTIHPGRPDSVWKFYLDLNSPVVDAPTIGPKMAEKLNAIEVKTIGDLLGAAPAEVAQALAEKAVTESIVENWQNQSMLVCRIPNLRGQDAQLLVAAGFRTAESVAEAKADLLYDAIIRIASTKQGLRFLRGGNPPDRDRVKSWIEWSKHSRAVKAA